jgi:hypothetical protein
MKIPLNHQACTATIADKRAKRVGPQVMLAASLQVQMNGSGPITFQDSTVDLAILHHLEK